MVCCSLCAIAISTVGIPVPQLADKDTTQPFPCQNRPCGCRDAAGCWRNCCCHNNQQKLEWARKMGVTPPEFVVQAAREEQLQQPKCCESKAKSCCSTSASCCSKPKKPGCSQEESGATKVAEEPRPPSGMIGLVLTQDYRKCRGMVEQFLELLSAVIIAPRIEFEIGTVVAELSFTSFELDSTDAVEPDVPPP
ncbi:hypothetical protein ETAA8_53870 [Anatilimnocola aggregata]|uniref:Uncharacterized protein n=2 Tax=Anatilimnocola aggregata TaxID=2528021 RepID=A0A517YJ67_9BACT|nr:hypothetical protein ETAA8_53870 [Anatilimnocola aggregata]